MINNHLVEDTLAAPDGWKDTEAQAQLRACLTTILSGHDEINTIMIAGEIITVMRDQLMGNAATVRRSAARAARENLGMMPQEIAKATHQTPATIARLLTESRPL
jgi:hypothetical protein